MRTLHLFAGGGGGLYADLILGHTPIAAVEWDPYACAILRSRAADGWFPGLRMHEGDVRMFDPSEYAGRVDCIHAGFPCQDISAAGKGAGITGERSGLYVEVMRAIDAIRPAWVMLENSPLIRTRGRHIVIADLVARGYSWRDGILSAADVGAPHKRDRWWLLAHPQRKQADGQWGTVECGWQPMGWGRQASFGENREAGTDRPPGRPAHVAHTSSPRCKEGIPGKGWSIHQRRGWRSQPERRGGEMAQPGREGLQVRQGTTAGQWPQPAITGGAWWDTEPDVGRLVDGLAHRSHQIRALGNGQVPLCAAAAWKLLGGP